MPHRRTSGLGIFALTWTCVALAGCGHVDTPSPFTGWFKPYENCRQQYAEQDARVDAAGVRDGSFWRIPGYPYLRTDRTLASFRNEVRGLNDVSEWVRRMRELDLEARDYENANLGLSESESERLRDRFLNCGRILATFELEDPTEWARLLSVVYPPDDYSSVQRAVGLYSLRAPSITELVTDRHEEVRRRVANGEDSSAPPKGHVREWRVRATEDNSVLETLTTTNQPNALGYPGLVGSQWRALAERHAPSLNIETTGDYDIPAKPFFGEHGVDANPSDPAVYYQFGFTRFRGAVLVQLSYSMWFKQSPLGRTSPIDGMIWRVTLDERFRPLVYESLHASGSDHQVHPVQDLRLRDDIVSPPPLVMPVPVGSALELSTQIHAPRVAMAQSHRESMSYSEYALLPYESLYTLEARSGPTRSLFTSEGFVVGSKGHDPIGGFASGIRNPGALRHTGHLAIAYVGRRHFDDPTLLSDLFVEATDHISAR